MHRTLLPLALLTAGALSASPATAVPQQDILTTAASNGSFDTLVSLVVAADLDEVLQADGELTVFAPTDAAFDALPEGTLAELRKPENRETLRAILTYHVVDGLIHVPVDPPSHPISSAESLQGGELTFTRDGTHVRVDAANVVIRDLHCSNGIVQVIDAVLMPAAAEPEHEPSEPNLAEVAAADGRFTTLLAAVEAAGLTDALTGEDPLTVLAPTDEAFAALPEGVVQQLLLPENQAALAGLLTDHVLPGRVAARDLAREDAVTALSGSTLEVDIRDGRLSVAGSGVVLSDIAAANGTIHVIDRVIVLGDPLADAGRVEELEIRATWKDHVVRDGVRAERLVISVTGGGSVRLTNVDAGSVETRVSGGGRAELAGRAGSHRAQVNGGAVLAARDLVTGETDMQVNGGGDAVVHATGRLAFRAHSGASVRYVDTGAEVVPDVAKYVTVEALPTSR